MSAAGTPAIIRDGDGISRLDTAAQVCVRALCASVVCERCAAHERFISDVEEIFNGDPAAVHDVATLLFKTLHASAEPAWREIVNGVATIVTNARTRTKCGPHYERLSRFLAENSDLLSFDQQRARVMSQCYL